MGSHDDAFLAEVVHTINQANAVYDENFNDLVYKAAATTSTWTGTGSTSFTSGQLAQSSSFDFNNGIVLSAILTSTEVAGSFTYEITADGTNWETVTSGVKHIFTNTGTDLRFRATESGASTGEISNIKIEEYH